MSVSGNVNGRLVGEVIEGFEGEAGPIATSDLGDGEEGTPVVGEAIEGGGGERWLAGLDGLEIIGGPTDQFPAEFVLQLSALVVETGGDFVGLGFCQVNDDRTIVERAGELADAGQGGWTEGPEGTDGVAFAFATIGARAALVAGVEEAPEFFGLRQPGVDFVEEKGGLILMNEAEEDGSGQVFRAQRTGGEGSDEVESGSFAAAGFGRAEVEARALGKGGEAVSM